MPIRAHLPPPSRRTGLIDISHRLQPRDYTIARLLDEHLTLTTPQLSALLFHNLTTCQHRLQLLRRMGFIDRFARNRPGRPQPLCWVAGPLSARYAALRRGTAAPSAKAVRERQDRTMANPQLDHLIGANQFFVDLVAHGRERQDARLDRWWSEHAAAAAFGRRIHPDGHGVWTQADASVGFFLEYDTGTEPLRRLIGKLAAYRLLQNEGGPQYPVLFVLPNRTREQNLHRRIAESVPPGIVIATTSPEAGDDPADAVWRLFGNGRRRHHLAELPSSDGQPGPLNPGPPRDEDNLMHAAAT